MKNLAYCVSLVQHDRQDYSTHNMSRMAQWAINCYKQELGFKTNKNVSVAYLTPNAAGNAPFPKDYEYYLKVSINLGGQLFTLSVNNDMALVRNWECGVEVEPPSSLDDLAETCAAGTYIYPYGFYYAGHYRAGQYVSEMYSMGGGFNVLGYFREDFQMRQFQFSNLPITEIVLEYVADEETSLETLIPYAAVEPIQKYIDWKYLYFNSNYNMGEKQQAQLLYSGAMNKYTHVQLLPSVQEYLDTSWAASKSSPKR